MFLEKCTYIFPSSSYKMVRKEKCIWDRMNYGRLLLFFIETEYAHLPKCIGHTLLWSHFRTHHDGSVGRVWLRRDRAGRGLL